MIAPDRYDTKIVSVLYIYKEHILLNHKLLIIGSNFNCFTVMCSCGIKFFINNPICKEVIKDNAIILTNQKKYKSPIERLNYL